MATCGVHPSKSARAGSTPCPPSINKNASGEYYITDVFEILRNDGRTVAAVDAVPAEDVLSVNDPAQLAEVDSILRTRQRATVGGATR